MFLITWTQWWKKRKCIQRPFTSIHYFICMIFGTGEFQAVLLRSSSSPLCRAPARTSWTTSCTSTGLFPSPSWPSVWSRCLLRTPAARGSLRWGRLRFYKTLSGTMHAGTVSKPPLRWCIEFLVENSQHPRVKSWLSCNISSSFIQLMRLSGYLFLCRVSFLSLHKLLHSEADYWCSVLSLGSLIFSRLINLLWVSEARSSSWNRYKSLQLPLTLHERGLMRFVHSLGSTVCHHACGIPFNVLKWVKIVNSVGSSEVRQVCPCCEKSHFF